MTAKKKQSSNRKKNSKPVAKVTSTPKSKEELKLTPDSVVILNVYEQGALKDPGFNGTPERFTVCTKTKLSHEAVQYFVSEEGNPNVQKYGKAFWSKMSKIQRLKANLTYTANGKDYDFSIVN